MPTIRQIRQQLAEYMKQSGQDLQAEDLEKLEQIYKRDPIKVNGSEISWANIINGLSNPLTAGTPLTPNQDAAQKLTQLVQMIPNDVVVVEQLMREVKEIEQQIRTMQEGAEKQEALKNLEIKKSQHLIMQEKLASRLDAAKTFARETGRTGQLQSSWFRAAGTTAPSSRSNGTGNFTTTTGKAASTDGRGAGGEAKSIGGRGAGFTPPATWGRSVGGPEFSNDTFMRSFAVDDYILNNFNKVLENQNRGRQLMMLFYYFAKKAESGDMGAIYQFMNFITYVISKDKAKQQIDLGKKLIELQDEQRRITDVLMNTKTDQADPNSNNEFMKTMTWAKSQSDSIATSQKLLAQSMETAGITIESVTNVAKGAVEIYGRISRRVSNISQ